MADVTQLRLELRDLEQRLSEKRTELYEAEVSMLPWKVGDTVRYIRPRYGMPAGSEWKITGIYNANFGWAKGVGRKKDGTWGVRERTLYDGFEVVSS